MSAKSPAAPASQSLTLRPLVPRDLDAVAAIDATLSGRSRRAYFERRLAATQRRPTLHTQFAVEERGVLLGYVFGRVLRGEFGRAEPAMRLEVIGVRADAQGRGIGGMLNAAFEQDARRRGLRELRTTALWRAHGMMRFLDANGWSLSRAFVVDCGLDELARGEASLGASDESPVLTPEHERPSDQHDYGSAPNANDFETLARDLAEVRTLALSDLDAVARIDARLTGRDRREYIREKLDEALIDAAIHVSLIAEKEGTTAGFLMATADHGDFGRTEPVAVIDTIGVDPNLAHRGVGHALLSQLFLNLRALRIERVETVVGMNNVDLLGLLSAVGFRPSERLAFVKPLA